MYLLLMLKMFLVKALDHNQKHDILLLLLLLLILVQFLLHRLHHPLLLNNLH
jgi:hypothetical protein